MRMKQDSSEKLLDWSENIKRQKLSNLSENAWCQEHGVSYHTFQYWKKKIHPKNDSRKKEQFIEIPEDRPWIEISLRGVKLSIFKDFDRGGLMSLLSLLNSKSC